MRRKQDLRRALRRRMARIITAQRASHPLCCLVWSIGSCCSDGLLAVRVLCLNHDATWRIPLEHDHAKTDTGPSLDSACPSIRTVECGSNPPGPQAAQAPQDVSTLPPQLSLLSPSPKE